LTNSNHGNTLSLKLLQYLCVTEKFKESTKIWLNFVSQFKRCCQGIILNLGRNVVTHSGNSADANQFLAMAIRVCKCLSERPFLSWKYAVIALTWLCKLFKYSLALPPTSLVSIRHQSFRAKASMSKESLHLLSNVERQILKCIDICHSPIAVSKKKTMMYITNQNIWAKNNIHVSNVT